MRQKKHALLPELPDEVIWKILLTVPVKPLVRFKCVSKSWNTLISDPQFTKEHLRTTTRTNQGMMVIVVRSNKIMSYSVESLLQNPTTPSPPHRCFKMKTFSSFNILGSCNGVLCFHHYRKRYLTLWNPSTGSTSKRFPFDDNYAAFKGLAYDPAKDVYKLLLLFIAENPHFIKSSSYTKIYTLSGNDTICSSKVILDDSSRRDKSIAPVDDSPGHDCRVPTAKTGLFFSGTLNWNAAKSEQKVILSFDFATETYRELLLPGDTHSNDVRRPVMNVLRDCLCVCYFDHKKTHWALWLMKEYGVRDSWTKLMTIPCFDECNAWPWPHSCPSLYPLCVLENGVAMFRTQYTNLVVYNSNQDKLEIRRGFCCNPYSFAYSECLQDWSCRESLVSPPR